MGESQGSVYALLEGFIVFLSMIGIVKLFADLIILFNMFWMQQ